MADPTARELKLIQYLNEAYGKEKQLEVTLQAQIKLAKPEKTLEKRLKDHYKETKAQSRNIEKRIKALGGKADTGPDLPGPDAVSGAVGGVTNVANKALAAAKGPVQALRGTGPEDNLLRNVRDAYWNEAEEIAHYNVIEAAANALDDKETAQLAKTHRREEERMQKFLEGQIDKLVKSVVRAEIPAKDRKAPGSTTSRRTTRSKPRTSSGTKRTTSRASSGTSTSRSTSSGSTAKKAASTTKKAASSTKRAASTTRKAASAGTKKAATTARKSNSASRSSRAKSSGGSSNGASTSSSSSSASKS